MIGGFEFAVWSARRVRFVMQADVGKPSAQALVGEQKEQRYVNAVGRQAVNVAAAVSLRQRLAFQLAQIVTELVESIIFLRELESGGDCLVNLLGVQPPTVLPLCRRTSSSRMILGSRSLMPG